MQEIVDRLTASDPGADVARTLLLPYLNHAATMYESGYATSADIDRSRRSRALGTSTTGPGGTVASNCAVAVSSASSSD